MRANPTAASQAPTAMARRAKTWPVMSSGVWRRENATRFRLAAFIMISREMTTATALRRVRAPYAPRANNSEVTKTTPVIGAHLYLPPVRSPRQQTTGRPRAQRPQRDHPEAPDPSDPIFLPL